jgi:hypothetical protein
MRRNKVHLIEFIKFFFDFNIFKPTLPSGFFFVFPRHYLWPYLLGLFDLVNTPWKIMKKLTTEQDDTNVLTLFLKAPHASSTLEVNHVLTSRVEVPKTPNFDADKKNPKKKNKTLENSAARL